MTTIKIKVAEVLFPLLSAFHEVNGLPLKAVRQGLVEDLLINIFLDFESKTLIISAEPDDDTVAFRTVNSFSPERTQGDDVSQAYPWKNLLEHEFGWGWVTINQQGYLDGVVLSFGGIMPQIIITVVASSLKVMQANH